LADSPVTIRPFARDDCGHALDLANSLGLSPWTLNDYREELLRDDSQMLAAADQQELAGFIIGRMVPTSSAAAGIDAEIYNIGVCRSFQRSGIGSQLLHEFISLCRKKDVFAVWLEVRALNSGAIRFYKFHGFEEFTVRPCFYRDPADDAIVMRLTLKRQ